MRNLTFLIAILVLLLVFGLLFIGCDNGTTGGINEITVPGNNLAEKLAWLEENAENEGNYLVELDADESSAPVALRYGDRTGITITLKGIGENHTISLSSNGSLFTVGSGVTLVLDNNITLKGRSGNDSGVVGAVGGTLVMNDGSVITGNATNFGGTVYMNGGTFIMNGGTISGNSGTGVGFERGGVFTMNGGSISDNTGNYGGGVRGSSGTFTMNGGAISSNSSIVADASAGRGGGGGGVLMSGETAIFIMTGGTISGNTGSRGGGVMASTFTMRGGIISGNTVITDGGGVVAGSFTMSGGTISGNTAGTIGGGVAVYGTFTKTGGTITGNDSEDGNVAKQNNGGNAIYAVTWNASSQSYSNIKRKQTSSGLADNLSYNGSTGTFSGAWDN